MAMVDVDSGSLYRRTGLVLDRRGRLEPFYIHQMNQVNSCNGSDSTINIVLELLLLLLSASLYFSKRGAY